MTGSRPVTATSRTPLRRAEHSTHSRPSGTARSTTTTTRASWPDRGALPAGPVGAAADAAPGAERRGSGDAGAGSRSAPRSWASPRPRSAGSPRSTRCTSAVRSGSTTSGSAPPRSARSWAATRSTRRLQDHLGIGNDETTDDGMITLEHVECNAACDFAPVMMVNWEFFDNTTPQKAMRGRRPAARRRDGARPPAGPGCAPGARPSGCSPASPTTGPTRARPRWPDPCWA